MCALSDQAFVDASVKENFEEMKRYESFAKELGFSIIESYTNFIVLEFDASKKSSDIAQNLWKKD